MSFYNYILSAVKLSKKKYTECTFKTVETVISPAISSRHTLKTLGVVCVLCQKWRRSIGWRSDESTMFQHRSMASTTLNAAFPSPIGYRKRPLIVEGHVFSCLLKLWIWRTLCTNSSISYVLLVTHNLRVRWGVRKIKENLEGSSLIDAQTG